MYIHAYFNVYQLKNLKKDVKLLSFYKDQLKTTQEAKSSTKRKNTLN